MNRAILPACLLIAGGLLLLQAAPPSPAPEPTPTPVPGQIIAPRAEWQALVQPVTQALQSNPPKAAALAGFCRDFATVLRSSSSVGSYGQVSATLASALEMSSTVLPVMQEPPAVGQVMNQAFDQMTGLATEQTYDRDTAADALMALAWAAQEAA